MSSGHKQSIWYNWLQLIIPGSSETQTTWNHKKIIVRFIYPTAIVCKMGTGILRCHIYAKWHETRWCFYLPFSFAFTWTSLYRDLNILALVATLAMNITVIYHMLKLLCPSINGLQKMLDICDVFFERIGRPKNILWNIMLEILLPFAKVNPAENSAVFYPQFAGLSEYVCWNKSLKVDNHYQ